MTNHIATRAFRLANASGLTQPLRIEQMQSELSECGDEIERLQAMVDRLQQTISEAVRKLSSVSIERDCKGVPEIVRVCDNQAIGILLEGCTKQGQ